MERKWVRAAGWAVLVLSGLFFVANGIQKLSGTEHAVAMFEALGLPDGMRILVGAMELAGGLCLVIPRLTTGAAVFLGCLMAGAVVVELRGGHTFGALIPAQWLVLFALVVWVRSKLHRAREKETV